MPRIGSLPELPPQKRELDYPGRGFSIPNPPVGLILTCYDSRSNETRFWLGALVYDFGNLWRRLALLNRIKSWWLRGHLGRGLFGSMLRMIAAALILPHG